jgi:hypothetical protein
MGWARRGNYEYYYDVRRIGRKVVTRYVGRGPAAHSVAQDVEARKAVRQRLRERRQRWQQTAELLKSYHKECSQLTVQHLIAHGYYQHHNTWRKRMRVKGEPPPCNVSQADLDEVVLAANGGNQEALARLREILDDNPAIWQRVGDLGHHVENLLLDMVAGSNTLLRESLERKIADMKRDLVGERPNVLEEMVAHRIIVCWLELQYADASHPEPSGSLAQGRFQLQRKESAQRRLQQALKIHQLAADITLKQQPGPPLRLVG